MKRNVLVLTVAVVVLSVSGVGAQQEIIDEVMAACAPEIEAYCSQVTPGEGRLLACAYAHEDKLSGECSWAIYKGVAELETFVDAVVEVAMACEDDLMEFCAEVEMGEGQVATCLLEHKAEVTEGCRAAIDDVGLEMVED